jgi:hypothetical protein
MSKPYFRNVPNFDYVNRNKDEKNLSNYIHVKNFFKRAKLRDDISDNLQFFTKYNIIGEDRPDNVAYKLYGDSTLDWVVLLANNIMNVYDEWPLTENMFEKFLLEKYGSYENLNMLHHYETLEVKNSYGFTLLPAGIKMSTTWRTNGNFVEANNAKISQIFAGDGVTSSPTITVVLQSGVSGISTNSEVEIYNIVEDVYNGKYAITSVYIPFNDGVVRSFTYELDTAPDVIKPYLSDNQLEEALFILKNSTVIGNSYYYEYYEPKIKNYIKVPSGSFLVPITNYQYELDIEANKRTIYVLKSEYLNVIFNDLDALMPYKEGGAQYISPTLKKGDNIRLYD